MSQQKAPSFARTEPQWTRKWRQEEERKKQERTSLKCYRYCSRYLRWRHAEIEEDGFVRLEVEQGIDSEGNFGAAKHATVTPFKDLFFASVKWGWLNGEEKARKGEGGPLANSLFLVLFALIRQGRNAFLPSDLLNTSFVRAWKNIVGVFLPRSFVPSPD